MTISPVNTPSSTSAASTGAAASSSASMQGSLNSLSNPNTFLQLLVAQLANQDPEQPADGTTFVTQLATFAGVEQQSQMRTDLDAINTVAQKYAVGPAAAPTTQPAGANAATTGSSN